jgi:hypothetical protein
MAITKLIANSITSGAIASTPAFEAYLSANQDVADAVQTKVQFDTELFDTDNCYDNSTNYRFTPTVAGKYYIYVGVQGRSDVNSLRDCDLLLRKNGSITKEQFHSMEGGEGKSLPTHLQMIVDMNGSTDYLEVFNRVNTSGSPTIRRFDGGSNKQTYFGAYRIIE